jgi:hypothetical protein
MAMTERQSAVMEVAPTPGTSRSEWIRGRLDPWTLEIWAGAFAVLMTASLHLIGQVGLSGDEPWYLLQGYALLHFHTVDVARVVQDPALFQQFLGGGRDDHTLAIPGSAGRVLTYLPGYAALVAPLDALGGRALLVAAQALAGAAVAALLFAEARRLHGSRAAGIFAALAFVTCLPALLYTGEIGPSTVATLAAFGAYLLVARALPTASGRRLVAVCAGVGLLALALPWLHVKYAPLALVIASAAGLLIARRMGLRPWPCGRRAEISRAASRGISARAARPPDGTARLSLLLACGLPALGLALIALYSHHSFGTWYPQYRAQTADAFLSQPDPLHMLGLYRQMLLDARQGLIPWAPLMASAPVGLALLWRRQPREAALAVAWTIGLLAAFTSSAIAPHVNQAYALPARFTVECQPYLALGAATVFARGWPSLRAAIDTARRQGVTSALRASSGTGLALALGCLALLAADAWLTLVGEMAPRLLYPTADGSMRLLAAYPHLLPGWWFALFGGHA